MKGGEVRGRVQYGARGFHQDASLAMKGDIVRALIETITNADDAYGDEKGKIRIDVEHRKNVDVSPTPYVVSAGCLEAASI